MNATRRGLLLCAVAAVLGTAACSTNEAAAAPAPVASAPVTSQQAVANQKQVVDAGIVTALTATSVSWTDGEVVKADAGPGYTIRELTGAAHRHTAALAPGVKLYLPFDAEGIVHLDKDNLGTVECTVPAKFKRHVLDNTMTAPRITFDGSGKVVTMAARYAS
jgi:hypothetical protein